VYRRSDARLIGRAVNALRFGSRPDRILRAGLWLLTGVVVAAAIRDLLAGYPVAVDIQIPLRAASRWLAGGQPYLASSFQAPVGPDLPFLYPPFLLPVIAVLTFLPETVVVAGWLAILLAAATWTCRRLAVPWVWIPAILLWPPFFEALLGGNVQILLFAALVGLMFGRADARTPFQPMERRLDGDDRPAWLDGLLAVVNPAIKPSQAQPWVLLLRRRPRAALSGALIVAGVVVVTLPLTGTQAWFDWLAQLGRASDPGWIYGGSGLAHGLPVAVGLGLTAATTLAAYFLPARFAAAWLGILMIVGNPSLRMFGLLMLLPGMLLVRREIALVAALCIASYTLQGLWLGVLLVTVALARGTRRAAWLEPVPTLGR
jgi:Glycosyltransferase family 87